MLDPKLIRDNPEAIRLLLERRNIAGFPLDQLVGLDAERRKLMTRSQELRKRKNHLAEAIAKSVKMGGKADAEISEMKQVGNDIKAAEEALAVADVSFEKLAMALPNILHESVPIGQSEADNKVIKVQGAPTSFNFKPKDHLDIATALDLVDQERAAKVSGARFYYLKNQLVQLNYALVRFAIDFLSSKGYSPIQPPYMIRRKPMEGAVILNDFEDVIYKVEDEDLFLIGTSEHALASMHMDEILDGKTLPIRYAGFSPCFRKEAGAHGKDMKGIFRVHQFEKVEQFVYCRPEKSWEEHERMLAVSEEFLRLLELPYRVVLLSSADTGKVSSKTYDIEVWMAGQQAYRELVSCSNCVEFQARRLGIRFRDRTNDETQLVHTLNSTLVATERTMVAILENFQTEDGKVMIPKALTKYTGFDAIKQH